MLLQAQEFGLPQRRVRLFIVGIHRERAELELNNTPDEILDSIIKQYLPMFRMSCPDVEPLLRVKPVLDVR